MPDIGKHEAEKRVEKLSYGSQYTWDPDLFISHVELIKELYQ